MDVLLQDAEEERPAAEHPSCRDDVCHRNPQLVPSSGKHGSPAGSNTSAERPLHLSKEAAKVFRNSFHGDAARERAGETRRSSICSCLLSDFRSGG